MAPGLISTAGSKCKIYRVVIPKITSAAGWDRSRIPLFAT